MSKNLKEEYLGMMEKEEIPDLWNRISSELPEKKIVSGSESYTAVMGNQKEKNSGQRKNIYRWSAVLAASVCLIIAMPLLNQSKYEKNITEGIAFQEEAALEKGNAVNMIESVEEDMEMLAAPGPEAGPFWIKLEIMTGTVDENGIATYEADVLETEDETEVVSGERILLIDENSEQKLLSGIVETKVEKDSGTDQKNIYKILK